MQIGKTHREALEWMLEEIKETRLSYLKAWGHLPEYEVAPVIGRYMAWEKVMKESLQSSEQPGGHLDVEMIKRLIRSNPTITTGQPGGISQDIIKHVASHIDPFISRDNHYPVEKVAEVAARAALAMKRESGWRPIETAPVSNGSHGLLR